MQREFRFPVPREERIVMLVVAAASPALIGVLVVVLADVAHGADMTLGGLFDSSRPLRASFAGLVLVYFLALYALAGFLRVKDGTRLTVGDRIGFQRPGIPLLGWFASEVSFDARDVDAIAVERARRGTVDRVEVRVTAGADAIAVNLAHAVEGDGWPRRDGAPPGRDQWRQTPLVEALEAATGRDAVC